MSWWNVQSRSPAPVRSIPCLCTARYLGAPINHFAVVVFNDHRGNRGPPVCIWHSLSRWPTQGVAWANYCWFIHKIQHAFFFFLNIHMLSLLVKDKAGVTCTISKALVLITTICHLFQKCYVTRRYVYVTWQNLSPNTRFFCYKSFYVRKKVARCCILCVSSSLYCNKNHASP